MRAFERWAEITAGGDPTPWLYRATANEAISRQRRERYSIKRLVMWLQDDRGDIAPLESLEAKELLAALDQLDPVERTIMWMKLVDGLRNGEVASALSLSDGYVTKLTQRAVKRLHELGWRSDHVD